MTAAAADVGANKRTSTCYSGLRGPMAQTPMSVVEVDPHWFRTSWGKRAIEPLKPLDK